MPFKLASFNVRTPMQIGQQFEPDKEEEDNVSEPSSEDDSDDMSEQGEVEDLALDDFDSEEDVAVGVIDTELFNPLDNVGVRFRNYKFGSSPNTLNKITRLQFDLSTRSYESAQRGDVSGTWIRFKHAPCTIALAHADWLILIQSALVDTWRRL
ncbi:unnamed protein product [Schistosoma spindalis]|nr:unnamed protein product [Schistosoma spindale]